MSNYTTKRKDYGIYVDTIGKANGYIANRVTEVRDQIKSRNYQDLEAVAKKEYEVSVQYVAQYGLKQGMKYPTLSGKRYHILCSAKGAIFLTYQYQHVSSDVQACLKAGTPVTVFSPYKDEDMVKVTSLGHWFELLLEERKHNMSYAKSQEYLAWEKETQYKLIAILNTKTPWLGTNMLHQYAAKFNNFDQFLLHAQARIAEIEENGEYDIELTSSMVMNEKAGCAHMVDKTGRRSFWCKDNPDTVDYWYNYEVLPADICMKFIHLTYLESIEYRPLKRMFTDGANISGKELWFGSAIEDMVRTTPIYFDPYAKHDKVEPELMVTPDEVQWMKSIGYEKAKAYLNGELNN